jgi:hypothetical protein
LYIDYIEKAFGLKGVKAEEFNQEMIEIEMIVEHLIRDEDVNQFLYASWLSKLYLDEDDYLHGMQFGGLFEKENVINAVREVLVDKLESEPVIPKGSKVNAFSIARAMLESQERKKDPGAIKLWESFSSFGESREEIIYLYVKAFCGIKTSGYRLVLEPKQYEKEKLTTGEKIGNSVAFSIMGNLLDVTGLGMVNKLDEWDEKKIFERNNKLYKLLNENLDVNPLDEILKKPKFQKVIMPLIDKVHGQST